MPQLIHPSLAPGQGPTSSLLQYIHQFLQAPSPWALSTPLSQTIGIYPRVSSEHGSFPSGFGYPFHFDPSMSIPYDAFYGNHPGYLPEQDKGAEIAAMPKKERLKQAETERKQYNERDFADQLESGQLTYDPLESPQEKALRIKRLRGGLSL
jgi:hypothetical protein